MDFTYCIKRVHTERETTYRLYFFYFQMDINNLFIYSLFLGHQNRQNVHSPTVSYNASMIDPRSIQNFALEILNGMNLSDIAERVWRLAVKVTTKAEIHKIYAIVLSVLA